MAENDPPGDPLSVLAQAERHVILGPYGAAAAWTPEARAFAALAEDVASHVEPLRRMLAQGPPAARCYAAFLLAKLGPEEASDAWRALLDCDEVVKFCAGGCIVMNTSVRELGQNQGFAAGTPPRPIAAGIPPRPTSRTGRLQMLGSLFWVFVVAIIWYLNHSRPR
jgi:hypothetical protein